MTEELHERQRAFIREALKITSATGAPGPRKSQATLERERSGLVSFFLFLSFFFRSVDPALVRAAVPSLPVSLALLYSRVFPVE